jgi:hypothetical protein
MKNFFKKVITAKDGKVRIAKSLIFGSFLAFAVGFCSSDTVYYSVGGSTGLRNGPNGIEEYNTFSRKEKVDFNELFIVLGFIMGTSIGFLVIRQNEPTK